MAREPLLLLSLDRWFTRMVHQANRRSCPARLSARAAPTISRSASWM